MKVLLVTRHFISNYGSFLQTYCTFSAIKKMGYQCDVLDYIDSNEKSFNSFKIWGKTNNKSKVEQLFYCLFVSIPNSVTEYSFRKLRERYLSLTDRISDNKDIGKLQKYDIYLCGSDQLWGRIAGKPYDPMYFLDFVNSFDCYCVSYASSFGDIDSNYSQTYKELLKSFSVISVRESSAKEYLKTIDIESSVVLDPTLLFDVKFYNSEITVKPKIKGEYILLYQLHSSNASNIALNLQKKTGIKIIRVSSNLSHSFKRTGRFYYSSDPFVFLNLIKNAKYLVTDSFHGTVFSTLFHIKMFVTSPGNTSSRIVDFMKEVGIIHRYMEKLDGSIIREEIEWKKIDGIIAEQRIRSIELLSNSLKGAKNER